MSYIEEWKKKNNFEDYKKYLKLNKNLYPQPLFLFRGESKKYPKPVSSKIIRESISRKKEMCYYQECFFNIYKKTSKQKYINLRFISFIQHYGFPTSLIDVTSNIDIALYFALDSLDSGDNHMDESGYVYILPGYDIRHIENFDLTNTNYETFLDESPASIFDDTDMRFIFYQDTNDYNINAVRQSGWHIIDFGVGLKRVEIKITPEDKKEIKKELENRPQKISSEVLFPNINNIAKEVNRKFNLYVQKNKS